MINILTVVGARPQFVKAAALSQHLLRHHSDEICERVVHTGQHFDENMSKVFFEQLNLPTPVATLESVTGTHGQTTGYMMSQLDGVFLDHNPDAILVYGDTNSTLAASLSASKLNLPIFHVEAGLRSHNLAMPEEINRIVTDRLSSLNLAPSKLAMQNLKQDGLEETSVLVGDIMFDAVREFGSKGRIPEQVSSHAHPANGFAFVTIHRQENTDNSQRLRSLVLGLKAFSAQLPIVVAAHPRLILSLRREGLESLLGSFALVLEPMSFFDSLACQRQSTLVLTDSGGIQKESFYLGTRCLTLRDETEWPETVETGWNQLCPPMTRDIPTAANALLSAKVSSASPYGDSFTSRKIVDAIHRFFDN